jgi:hypothetical protein
MRSKYILASLALLLLFLLNGASLGWAQVPNLTWEELGPDNKGGRTRAMAKLSDGSILIGGHGAGLWRGRFPEAGSANPLGIVWRPVTSFNNPTDINANACLNVSSIAVDGNTIYVGTGEFFFNRVSVGGRFLDAYTSAPNQSDAMVINEQKGPYLGASGQPGQGVFVSTDNGATWSNTNATWSERGTNTQYETASTPFVSIQKVLTNNGRVFVATLRGLYISDDKLATVNLAQEQYSTSVPTKERMDSTAILDIEVGDNNTIYAVSTKRIFISRDNGNTFTESIDAFSDFNYEGLNRSVELTRIELAVAGGDKKVAYAAVVNANFIVAGVFRTGDNGATWSNSIAPSEQSVFNPTIVQSNSNGTFGCGVYALTLFVDPRPSQVNRVFLGGRRLFAYDQVDGWGPVSNIGREFVPNIPGYIPPFVLSIFPVTENLWLVGTDRMILATPDYGDNYFQATAAYNGASVLSVATNAKNEVIAMTDNAGVLFKVTEPTKSFRNLDEEDLGNYRGNVQTSTYNSSHIVIGGNGFNIRRSLNDGENFENFFEGRGTYGVCLADDIKPAGTGISDGGGDREDALLMSPIALDEVVNPDSPLLYDSLRRISADKKQYLFTASDRSIWLVTNPFAVEKRFPGPNENADSIANWIRIARDLTTIFECPRQGNIPPCAPTAMTVSGDERHILYIGFSNGRIIRIYNAHSPCDSNNQATLPVNKNSNFRIDDLTQEDMPQRMVTSLNVLPGERGDTLIATFGGYRSGNERDNNTIMACFNATDTTATPKTFYAQQGTLPFSMPVYATFVNPNNPKSWMLLGTEQGIYHVDISRFTTDPAAAFDIPYTNLSNNVIPRVPVTSFGFKKTIVKTEVDTATKRSQQFLINNPNAYLYAGTLGRGVFRAKITGDLRVSSLNPLKKSNRDDNHLVQIYPNPTQGQTTMKVRVQQLSNLTCNVYNLEGRLVQQQSWSNQMPGLHTYDLQTEQLPTGLYMVQTQIGGQNGDSQVARHKLFVE